MNIEQIKKDWEQHCKEYGVVPLTDIHKTRIPLKGNYETIVLFTEDRCGHIQYSERSSLLQILDFKETKLFTTFYEKLMEASDE